MDFPLSEKKLKVLQERLAHAKDVAAKDVATRDVATRDVYQSDPECHKHKCHKHKSSSCKKTCDCQYFLGKRDFCRGKTYHITKPGKYCLKSDIRFEPTEDINAILIDSDDVVLNLCGHTLSQVNDTDAVSGVRVVTGHRNVTILGSYGAIRDFSRFGIRVEAGSEGITIGDQTKLEVTGCGVSHPENYGWFAASAGGVYIGDTWANDDPYWGLVTRDVKLQNVQCSGNNWCGGAILSCENVLVDGCSFSNNRALIDFWGDCTCFAVYQVNVAETSWFEGEPRNKNIKYVDTSFDDNSNVNTGNANFNFTVGSYASLEDFLFERCTFNNNSSLARGRGMVMVWSDTGKFLDCSFSGNKGGWSAEGFHASGNFVTAVNRCSSIDFIRCKADDNIAHVTEETPLTSNEYNQFVAGYSNIYSYTFRYFDSTANGNKYLVDEEIEVTRGFAAGFRLSGGNTSFGKYLDSKDFTLTNCQACFNESNSTGRAYAQGVQIGLYVDVSPSQGRPGIPETSNVSILGGQYNNNKSEYSEGSGIRLTLWKDVAVDGHVIREAVIEDNSSDGIIISPSTGNSLFVDNSIISNDRYGIHLESGAKDNVVKSNVLIGNGLEGIKEVDVGTNLIIDNTEYNNGP